MHLPLCFSSLGCTELSVDDLCQLAMRHQVPFVEIRSLDYTVDYPLRLATEAGLVANARTALETHGVRLALLGSSFSLTRSGPADIDGLLQVCQAADALNAPYVRVFGGGQDGSKLTDSEIAGAAQLYQLAYDRWQKAGVRAQLLVETHGGLVTSSAIEQFCQLCGRDVQFLWDTHHTWKIGGEPLEQTFALIGERVRHLHCKDSIPRADRSGAYDYVVPGQGGFPFASLFQITARMPSEVRLSLEWERQWHPEIAPLEQALAHFTALVATRP